MYSSDNITELLIRAHLELNRRSATESLAPAIQTLSWLLRGFYLFQCTAVRFDYSPEDSERKKNKNLTCNSFDRLPNSGTDESCDFVPFLIFNKLLYVFSLFTGAVLLAMGLTYQALSWALFLSNLNSKPLLKRRSIYSLVNFLQRIMKTLLQTLKNGSQ